MPVFIFSPNRPYKLSLFTDNAKVSVNKLSLFTDNAKVYYKPHSLAPGGIGTVRNYRHKARKT